MTIVEAELGGGQRQCIIMGRVPALQEIHQKCPIKR